MSARFKLLIVLATLLVVGGLALQMNRQQPATGDGGGSGKDDSSEIRWSGNGGDHSSEGFRRTGKSSRVRQAPEEIDDEIVQQFPLIDRVLADESLSISDSARELRMIVDRPDASLIEREEALAHGLNLDFQQFADLATDPELPQPLALRLFDHMLNENQSRNLQVQVCLDLMKNGNEEIRNEASEQLAFYVGFEELVDQPAVLRSEALAFLEDWRNNPPTDPEPEEETGDILTTAPIELVDEDEDDVDAEDD